MGFWTGIADAWGLQPIHNPLDFIKDAGSVLSMGMYNARDNDFGFFQGSNPIQAGLSGVISDRWSDVVSSTTDGVLAGLNDLREQDLLDYAGDLFQTDADAALDQAMTNDALSKAAWLRSEESADNALRRARELRSTYYQDLRNSLKAAGLNPVLAASGGFGGVSSSAPMGTSQAASSQKAEGLKASDLLLALASILNGAGSLLSGVTRSSPAGIITKAGKIGF